MRAQLETLRGSKVLLEIDAIDCRVPLIAEDPRVVPSRRVFEYDGELRDVPRFVEIEHELQPIYLPEETALMVLRLK